MQIICVEKIVLLTIIAISLVFSSIPNYLEDINNEYAELRYNHLASKNLCVF